MSDAGIEQIGASVEAEHVSANRMRKTGLGYVEIHPCLCGPGAERGPEAVRDGVDMGYGFALAANGIERIIAFHFAQLERSTLRANHGCATVGATARVFAHATTCRRTGSARRSARSARAGDGS